MPKSIEKQLAADDADRISDALTTGDLTASMLSKDGNTAIHEACRHGSVKCLDICIANGFSLDVARGADGGTPLMYTAQNGHAACMQRLLAAGAAVNLQQAEGTTALHYSSRWNHVECVDLLLANKVSINAARNDGITALMISARHGNPAVVDRLIGAKADPKLRSKEHLAALRS